MANLPKGKLFFSHSPPRPQSGEYLRRRAESHISSKSAGWQHGRMWFLARYRHGALCNNAESPRSTRMNDDTPTRVWFRRTTLYTRAQCVTSGVFNRRGARLSVSINSSARQFDTGVRRARRRARDGSNVTDRQNARWRGRNKGRGDVKFWLPLGIAH